WLMMSLWDALRMNMMISYQELVRTFPLAQQWQAGNSVWSRPAIRIFATYAKWDENWGYSNTSGLQTKDSSGSGAFTSSRGDDSEVTFGAQMEVWW
ncbi:carbohydrate porin, partial [Klebsiella pneumoniae]|uniref:carbohydrate porin n=1 Tax=Klebsiella pneumoniae TaxID=573 RepID=UPI001FAF15BA